MSEKPVQPPRLGEKVLALFLNPADQEAVIGDFAETFYRVAERDGPGKARWWYWREVVISMPALLCLSQNKVTRSDVMERLSFLQQNNKLAVAGVVLIIPAMLLVVGGLLQSLLGISQVNEALNFELFIFHPAILLGGLVVALGLNLAPVARVSLQDGALVGTLKIRGRLVNLAILAFIGLMLGTIFVYLLVENFEIFGL